MELVDYDDEAITIRITPLEMARLRAVLAAVVVDYSGVDPEIIDMTKTEVEQLESAFAEVDDTIPL